MTTHEEQQIQWMEMLKERIDIRIDCVVKSISFKEEIVLTINGLEVQTRIGWDDGIILTSCIWIDDSLMDRLKEHYSRLRIDFDKFVKLSAE